MPLPRSCSSSDQLVGRDWAVAKRMRTLPLEVGLQSAQLVVGQHADSPSSLELAERLFAAVGELVVTLARDWDEWDRRSDFPRSSRALLASVAKRVPLLALGPMEVVGPFSMELHVLECQRLDAYAKRSPCPCCCELQSECCTEHRERNAVLKDVTLGHPPVQCPRDHPCDPCSVRSP